MTAPARISHYELIARIGRDGPTEIYRARDIRLEREVAIKLLRPEEMARPDAIDRFRREARISSLVSHPHICAVHDSGEENGQPFLVCELLEGRALDELLQEGPLPVASMLDLGSQMVEALAAAHRRNIIHANLKPSNVFVTSDGHVKLLELGAASAALPAGSAVDSDSATKTTSVDMPAATAVPAGDLFHAYLAPEQIAGRGVDHRADVFAAGALLYEMATGTRAFNGSTPAAVAAAIAGQDPPRPRSVNRRLPRSLTPVLARALAKDPAARHQSASDLLDDLRAVRRSIDLQVRLRARWPFKPAVTAAGLAVAVLAIVAAVGIARGWKRPGDAPAVERSAVLVSQFANGTADPDFDGTLREAVTVYLAQSPYLDLASDERVRATLRLMGRDPATRLTHDSALEVCQRMGLSAVLEGSVSAIGKDTVVALVATDCGTGATIGRQQVEVERKEDVLRAMGSLTASIRTALGESRASLARYNVPVEEATTPSLEALKAYTQGISRRAEGDETGAIPFLERAIQLDSKFGLAYTTLSTLYGGLGESGRSEELARRAYENRAHVSERERLFITYQYHDRVTGDQLKAREALVVWKRTYPRDYRPANALAVLLLRLGDYDHAIEEAEDAIRRNPAHTFPYSNLAFAHRGAGHYAQARAVATQTVEKRIETVPTRRLLYQLGELEHDPALIRAQLEWAAQNARGFDVTGARAQVAGYYGRVAEARRLFAETIGAATKNGFSQIASGYAAQAVLMDALYGYERQAVQDARRVMRSSTAYEPQLRAATALALAGAPDEAEQVVRRLRHVRPDDTLLHAAYRLPAEAAVELRRGAAAAAIETLRASAPFERGMVAALVPALLRGEARLRAADADEAIADFQTVIDARGADPFSPVVPLAYRGLVRAHALRGNAAASAEARAALDRIWANADADLPVRAAVADARESRR